MTQDDLKILMEAVAEVTAEYVSTRLQPLLQRLDALEAMERSTTKKARLRVPAGRQVGHRHDG